MLSIWAITLFKKVHEVFYFQGQRKGDLIIKRRTKDSPSSGTIKYKSPVLQWTWLSFEKVHEFIIFKVNVRTISYRVADQRLFVQRDLKYRGLHVTLIDFISCGFFSDRWTRVLSCRWTWCTWRTTTATASMIHAHLVH